MTITRENTAELRDSLPMAVEAAPSRIRRVRRALRPMVMSTLWIAGGVCLFGYAGMLTYNNVARIEIDSALVAGNVEPIKAPERGFIKDLILAAGEDIQGSDKLFAVRNPEIEERIGLASIRVEKAREELRVREAELGVFMSDFNDKMLVLKTAVADADAEIAGISIQVDGASRRVDDLTRLFKAGHTTRPVLTEMVDRLASLSSDLERARIRRQHKETLVATAERTGLLPDSTGSHKLDVLKARLQQARTDLELAVEELRILTERRYEAQSIAEASGKVLKVLRREGSFVEQGETVAIVERGSDRFVHAFLTQSEVQQVNIGDEAQFFLPAYNVTTTLRVIAIERSGAFLEDAEHRYGWQVARDPGTRRRNATGRPG